VSQAQRVVILLFTAWSFCIAPDLRFSHRKLVKLPLYFPASIYYTYCSRAVMLGQLQRLPTELSREVF
jgi:hypothetical protein